MEQEKKLFGLIGKNIGYSFSKTHFTEKFSKDPFLDCEFQNFDINKIELLKNILSENQNLKGLCVTIPYKQSVIPYLDKLSKKATQIGAVNVIRFTKKGKLKGCNSDYYGFKKTLEPLLRSHHKKALIFGTGGAAKAVAFALDELDILYTFVSRNPAENTIFYDRINATSFDNFQLFINCTPLGTSPNVDEFPPIPYQYFTKNHIAFDLVYNPSVTEFLKKAKEQGAEIKNGMKMLVFQAEKAWEIWNK